MKYLAILAILVLTATNVLAGDGQCAGPKVSDYTEFYKKVEGGRHVTITNKEEINKMFLTLVDRLNLENDARLNEDVVRVDLYFWRKRKVVTYVTSALNGQMCSQIELDKNIFKGVVGEDI